MDIDICMQASYFGLPDFTVKCIQSKKDICMSKQCAVNADLSMARH